MAQNDELLEQIGKLIDAKLEPLKREMVTKADLEGVEKRLTEKIEREAGAVAEFFHETWTKMEATNERVTKLEEHTGLTTPDKN
jgi:hypothetical protein